MSSISSRGAEADVTVDFSALEEGDILVMRECGSTDTPVHHRIVTGMRSQGVINTASVQSPEWEVPFLVVGNLIYTGMAYLEVLQVHRSSDRLVA